MLLACAQTVCLGPLTCCILVTPWPYLLVQAVGFMVNTKSLPYLGQGAPENYELVLVRPHRGGVNGVDGRVKRDQGGE